MDKKIREYMAEIGRKGGKKSKRVLTSEQARAMVKARERKRKAKGN
jgi:general stress protein YciG